MQHKTFETSINSWLMRRAVPNAIRRVADFSLALGSDVGLVRKENQDRVAIARLTNGRGHNYVVGILCDGMGGMELGGTCATLAVSSFLTSCHRNAFLTPKGRLSQATLDANNAVYDVFSGSGGTTLSAFLYEDDNNFIGVNVGDSRIYSISKTIDQLTVDDTLSGHFDGEIAKDHNHGRNDLLQFVGIGKDIEPHIIEFPEKGKDTLFMLTSDGVHFLPKEIMHTISTVANEPGLIIRRLLEVSKWCGGRDNASLIVFSRESLLSETNDENLVEIWDSFGELQLFQSEKPRNIQTSTDLSVNKNISQVGICLVEQNDSKNKHSKAKQRTNQRKGRKPKQKSLELNSGVENKSEVETPKLIIQFEESHSK